MQLLKWVAIKLGLSIFLVLDLIGIWICLALAASGQLSGTIMDESPVVLIGKSAVGIGMAVLVVMMLFSEPSDLQNSEKKVLRH